MALKCDVCSGALSMQSGGQGAVCTVCGMTYSLQRLREMTGAAQSEPPKSAREVYGFSMTVEDVFHIAGRGIVATGTISAGAVRVGDVVQLPGGRRCVVESIEQFRKMVSEAVAGESVGLLLKGRGFLLRKNGIKRGDTLTDPTGRPGGDTEWVDKIFGKPGVWGKAPAQRPTTRVQEPVQSADDDEIYDVDWEELD